jgi:hypothetical protein
MSKFSTPRRVDEDSHSSPGLEPQFIRAAVQFPTALVYIIIISDGLSTYTHGIDIQLSIRIAAAHNMCTDRHRVCCVYIYVDVFICDSGHMQLASREKKRKVPYSSQHNCDMLCPTAPLLFQTPLFPYVRCV